MFALHESSVSGDREIKGESKECENNKNEKQILFPHFEANFDGDDDDNDGSLNNSQIIIGCDCIYNCNYTSQCECPHCAFLHIVT